MLIKINGLFCNPEIRHKTEIFALKTFPETRHAPDAYIKPRANFKNHFGRPRLWVHCYSWRSARPTIAQPCEQVQDHTQKKIPPVRGTKFNTKFKATNTKTQYYFLLK